MAFWHHQSFVALEKDAQRNQEFLFVPDVSPYENAAHRCTRYCHCLASVNIFTTGSRSQKSLVVEGNENNRNVPLFVFDAFKDPYQDSK
jgi:hypothetical protein